MENIQYSYLRAEKNNDIVVFVKVNPEWLDQEIYFGIENNKITVKLPNDEIYVSEMLEPMLLEIFAQKSIPVVFTDNEGNFLAEINLLSNNSQKVKS